MKYKLIKDINPNYTTIQQVLTNRGIPLDEISNYLNTTDSCINEPEALGIEEMRGGASILINAIKKEEDCLLIVD